VVGIPWFDWALAAILSAVLVFFPGFYPGVAVSPVKLEAL